MKSKHFAIHELVPKKMYYKYGEKAWRYIDTRLIESIDKLKERFSEGSMTINNYHWEGDREWSGIRTPDSKWYSYGSQHSFANALDVVFSKYTAKEVRDYILLNLEEFPYLRGLEIATWLHIDVRNEDNIVVFDADNKVYTIKEALEHK